MEGSTEELRRRNQERVSARGDKNQNQLSVTVVRTESKSSSQDKKVWPPLGQVLEPAGPAHRKPSTGSAGPGQSALRPPDPSRLRAELLTESSLSNQPAHFGINGGTADDHATFRRVTK